MKLVKRSIIALSIFALGCMPAIQAQQPSAHRANHQALMASRANSKDRVRLLEGNILPNVVETTEQAIEISMEGWNSNRVNPFSESQVPDVRGYCMPVPGGVTSNYGYRAKFGRMHKGIDLHLRPNDTIYAAFDGKVRVSKYEARGFGNYLIQNGDSGVPRLRQGPDGSAPRLEHALLLTVCKPLAPASLAQRLPGSRSPGQCIQDEGGKVVFPLPGDPSIRLQGITGAQSMATSLMEVQGQILLPKHVNRPPQGPAFHQSPVPLRSAASPDGQGMAAVGKELSLNSV